MINTKKDYWNEKPLRYRIKQAQIDLSLSLDHYRWVVTEGCSMPEWYNRSWRNYSAVKGRKGLKTKLINKSKMFRI